MKKTVALIIVLTYIFCLAGCGNVSKVEIDYGNSSIFTKEDMDSAIALIKATFLTWEGCELHSISYSSDDECNSENIAWMNDLAEGEDIDADFTQCIMFYSSFHSPVKGGGAWEADEEYENWQWWLARSEGGEWHLLTWGY